MEDAQSRPGTGAGALAVWFAVGPQKLRHSYLCDHKAIRSYKLESYLICYYTAVTMGNVGEGSSMYKHWSGLKGLQEQQAKCNIMSIAQL